MSDSREALLERFRAGLLERIGHVQSLLQELGAANAPESMHKSALGELHTLKGEARMLGLGSLSELAHALESEFARPGALSQHETKHRIATALDAMHASLEPDVDERTADALLDAALAELGPRSVRVADEQVPISIRTPVLKNIVETLDPTLAASEPGQGDSEARPDARIEARKTQRFAQVDVTTVDTLCDRIAELSAAFGQLQARAGNRVRENGAPKAEDLALLEHFAKCRTLLDESTTTAWSLRLLSVEPMLRELARHARSLAMRVGKLIDVKVHTGGAQLERDVLDQLWESLLHLVQNAVDHGLEPKGERGDKPEVGSVTISAEPHGSNVVLRVKDDGRGIDPKLVRKNAVARGIFSASAAEQASDSEVVQLLFEHGFSTRDTVTEISGRGIGLDVVRQKVESLGGHVEIATELGRGTRFSLHVPFAMTRERLMIVEVADTLYALPSRIVRAVREVENASDAILHFEDEPVPVRALARALGISSVQKEAVALVIEIAGKRYGLAVPRVLGERELIRRPAEPLLAGAGVIGASAVLEDGRLVLLLELGYLLGALRKRTAAIAALEPLARTRRQRVVVVDDSPVVRELVSEVLASAGLEVQSCQDGAQALGVIEQNLPDLVLSDVEMPRMNGFELLAEIRNRSQRLPVIMLTTRGSVEDRRRAASLGANAYLVKADFRGDTLLDVVRRFVHVSA